MLKVTLDCVKCGGPLEVTEQMDMFKCPFCETPYMVERSEGTVKIIKLEHRVEQLEVEQQQIRANVASMELKDHLAAQNEMIQKFKQENQSSQMWYWGGGAVIGLFGFMLFTYLDYLIFGDAVFLSCIGFIWPILGMIWGAKLWTAKILQPHKKSLEVSRAKEAELRAIIEQANSDQ